MWVILQGGPLSWQNKGVVRNGSWLRGIHSFLRYKTVSMAASTGRNRGTGFGEKVGVIMASLGFPALADGIVTTMSPWKPSESSNENSVLLSLNITRICKALHAHQREVFLASLATCWPLWSWNQWGAQAQAPWRRWWQHISIFYQRPALFKTPAVLLEEELFQTQTTDTLWAYFFTFISQ